MNIIKKAAARFIALVNTVLDGKSNADHHAAAKKVRARAMAGKIAAWYRDHMADAIQHVAPVISHENKKLKDTAAIAFLIWNLPAMLTCPGATAMCMSACYARSAEIWPTVRRSRLDNLLFTRRADFVDLVCAALYEITHTKAGKLRKPFIGKQIVFRVHESGDFYNVAYMRAWIEIARRNPDITFFAYTKSFDVLATCINEIPDNFIIRASIWADTDADRVQFIVDNNLPYYTAVPESELDDIIKAVGGSACNCAAGCGACNCTCAVRAAADIFAAIH